MGRHLMAANSAMSPSRRHLLLSAGSLGVLGAVAALPRAARAAAGPQMVTIENFAPSGKSLGRASVAKVVKSEADWKKMLAPESFEVTRHADTEAPFTGAYWKLQADGLFRCICCDTALFDSQTEIRFRHGLAELLAADLADQCRADGRQHLRHGSHGDFLQALRRASGPCVRRRPEADRAYATA